MSIKIFFSLDFIHPSIALFIKFENIATVSVSDKKSMLGPAEFI